MKPNTNVMRFAEYVPLLCQPSNITLCLGVLPKPYFRKQAKQTLSLVLFSELIEPELGNSDFSVPEQLIRIGSSALSRFSQREAHTTAL